MSKQIGSGAAVSVTDLLPDLDVFCNRGAKDITPLWLDSLGTQPNITQNLVETISNIFDLTISPEEMVAYCCAVLAGPQFTAEFSDELQTPGPRIPITRDPELFASGVKLGAKFVWLQTFRSRSLAGFPNATMQRPDSRRIKSPISDSEDSYPEVF